MRWPLPVESYNNAAIEEDPPHGTSEKCPGLCEGLSVSDLRHQTSAGADCDFSAGYFQDGPNSSHDSLSTDVDSQSLSKLFDEFIIYPPPSSTCSSTFELPSPDPQPSSSQLHCSECQREFPSVNRALQHIAETHRLAGSQPWPCVEPNCGLSFRYEKDLRRHLVYRHLGLRYTCACGRRARLDKHMQHISDPERNCKSVGPYTCECGAKTDSRSPSDLSDHLRHIKVVRFTCSCGQRHPVAEHLNHLHHLQCRRESPYICHCGKITNSHTERGRDEHRRHVEEECPHGPSYSLNGQPRQRGRPRKMRNENVSTQRQTD